MEPFAEKSGHDVRPDLTSNEASGRRIPRMPLYAGDATPSAVEHTRVPSMT
ncbi:hypothetical protein [Microbacterium sp.]|jgi:hypothetical protein|uniref:hypothetical protein n=1 Tax=Microbacterium sp. TaxID=51671 RepID=UPI0037C67796